MTADQDFCTEVLKIPSQFLKIICKIRKQQQQKLTFEHGANQYAKSNKG